MGIVGSSAEADGSPEALAAAILSPDGLKQWFKGVTRAEADAGWPGKGTGMRWWVGREGRLKSPFRVPATAMGSR